MTIEIDILFEDNHLLVLNKPPLLPTMGVAEGADSLLQRGKAYLKERYQKPGNVYLGVVSRLDATVTGTIVFARTSKAAARLSEAFRLHRVEKHYLAIAAGAVIPPQGTWRNWLWRSEPLQRMLTCDAGRSGAQNAELSYQVRATGPLWSALQITLLTGRRHQIRVQLAARGHPIAGDSKYGSRLKFQPGIALHAFSLAFPHPVRDELIRIQCPPPTSWQRWKLDSSWQNRSEG